MAGAGSAVEAAVCPGVPADQVDGGGGGNVVCVGFGQASVSGAADTGDIADLVDGSLDAGAAFVVLLPAGVGLGGAGGHLGFEGFAGADGDLAAFPDRAGAVRAGRAGAAIGRREGDDGLVGAFLDAFGPGGGDGADRAGRGAGAEVDVEVGASEPGAGAGLRADVSQHRGDDGDAVLAPGGDQVFGAGVAGI